MFTFRTIKQTKLLNFPVLDNIKLYRNPIGIESVYFFYNIIKFNMFQLLYYFKWKFKLFISKFLTI